MLIELQRITPDGRPDYAILVNTDDITLVRKEDMSCGCYYAADCLHDPKTIVEMRNGDKFYVDESIKTITARMELSNDH